MKNVLTAIISFIILSPLGDSLRSEPLDRLRYTDYTVENGLSYNSVIDICQDTCGTMWFATNDGLNRFNGQDIYIYRHIHNNKTSLPSNSLHKVIMDTDGTIWACTANGLAYYDAVADVFRRADIPGAVSVEDMVQIDRERFLVSTRNASYIYDKGKGTSSEYKLDGKPLIFYSACRDGKKHSGLYKMEND